MTTITRFTFTFTFALICAFVSALGLAAQTTVNLPTVTINAEATSAVTSWALGQTTPIGSGSTPVLLVNAIGSADLTVTISDATGLKGSMDLLIDSEALVITKITKDPAPAKSAVITVTRGDWGTTAASHIASTQVTALTYGGWNVLLKALLAGKIGEIVDIQCPTTPTACPTISGAQTTIKNAQLTLQTTKAAMVN